MLSASLWWLPALIGSFVGALFAEANRRYQMGGRRLSFWQLGLSACFLFPIVLFMDWPTSPAFYGVAVVNGIAMSYGSIRQLRLAADYNGRIASLFAPVKVIIAFFLWMVLNYIKSEPIFDDPVQLWGICGVLATMVGAFIFMVRDKMNLQIFQHIIPVSLSYAILDICIKLVNEPSMDAVFVFVFIAMFSASSTVMAFMMYRGKKKEMLEKKLVKAGAFMATCGVSSMLCFMFSLQAAENPAYPTVVMLLSSVWLLLYYRVKKVPDNISPLTGTVLVFCAISLVFLTTR